MNFSTTQYLAYTLFLFALTFAAGCSVGNTYRKVRTPVKANNAKSRNR
jgi:hypothetical protein